MSESNIPKIGTLGWVDLTVPDAETVRDFYKQVVGWGSLPVSMGDYNDYCMTPPGSDQPVAGVCHARGVNAALPPQWLIYINVEDLDVSIASCKALGGEVISGPRNFGPEARYAIIKDPAGAACALFCSKAS
jgi:hypothetical protein